MGRSKERCLPDAAAMGRIHLVAHFAAKRLSELRHVRDYAVGSKLSGGVGIGLSREAGLFGPHILAPDISEAKKELLGLRISVLLGIERSRFFGEIIKEGHVCEKDPAILASSSAKRQLTVQFDAGHRAEATVLIDDTIGELFELLT